MFISYLEYLELHEKFFNIVIDGERWYRRKDVLKFLDYKNLGHPATLISEENKKVVSIKQYPEIEHLENKRINPQIALVNDAGVLEMIMRCNSERGIEIRNWITAKALEYFVSGMWLNLKFDK